MHNLGNYNNHFVIGPGHDIDKQKLIHQTKRTENTKIFNKKKIKDNGKKNFQARYIDLSMMVSN